MRLTVGKELLHECSVDQLTRGKVLPTHLRSILLHSTEKKIISIYCALQQNVLNITTLFNIRFCWSIHSWKVSSWWTLMNIYKRNIHTNMNIFFSEYTWCTTHYKGQMLRELCLYIQHCILSDAVLNWCFVFLGRVISQL